MELSLSCFKVERRVLEVGEYVTLPCRGVCVCVYGGGGVGGGGQRVQEVHLLWSPVLLSPLQPCLTRAKTCCLMHSCQGKRRRRCGETEEVWDDGGEKGGGGRWMTGSENGKAEKRTFSLTFFFYGSENLVSLSWERSHFENKSRWDSSSGKAPRKGGPWLSLRHAEQNQKAVTATTH